MRLYELSDAIRNLEGIEDADQFAAALEDLNLEWDKKIEDLAKWIRGLQAEGEAYESEARRLLDAATARNKRALSVANYICQEMTARQVDKTGKLLKVDRVLSGPSCNILDMEVLPDAYIRHIPARFEADKKAIIERWKQTGEQLPGTEVSQKYHIRIYP